MGRLLFFWMSSFLVTFICYWTLTAAADDGSQQDDNNRNGIHSSKLLSSIGIKLNRETTRQNPDEGILLDSNKDLQLIRRIIGELKMEVVAPKKKKTCLFNLGGHCSTESAAFLADRWHYLDSPMSPGRKRFSNSRGTARELEERQVNDGRE